MGPVLYFDVQKISMKTFLTQLLITLTGAFSLSIIYTLLQGGLSSYLPLQSLFIILVTMAFSLVIGLPIRMSDKINSWWLHHQLIPITGAIIGSLLMLAGAFIRYKHIYPVGEGTAEVLIVPDTLVSGCGWSVAIFSLLHLYLPIPRRNLWARRVA